MKLIPGGAIWATNELTPEPLDWPKANYVLEAPEGKPLHRVLRKGRLRKLERRMERAGWEGRPLLAYRNDREEIIFLTGSHRWQAAYNTNTPIPTFLVDLAAHDYKEECKICGNYFQWKEYENPCEILIGYRDYREISGALKDMGHEEAARLFDIDARPI